MSTAPGLYIGLMSGTSLDGVDGVLADLSPDARLKMLAHVHQPFSPALRSQLMELNQPGPDELHRAALAANGVALAYADVVHQLLRLGNVEVLDVRAIGAHGQTVRHRPGAFDGIGYTSQLLQGALLAELTGIDVVADFRSRDVAAGGQGAPLVPAFHQAAFAQAGRDVAVLNIGGMANLTFLPATGPVTGHDCGPGNVLLDLWCQRHQGQPLDIDGAWGRQGRLVPSLLDALLEDAFIKQPPPKSTGRDHFHANWLDQMLNARAGGALQPVDVQHTLTWFTAHAAAGSLQLCLPAANELLVCGGGALNGFLMECLQRVAPTAVVRSIDQVSAMDPMHVEAMAFAWFAQAHVQRRLGSLAAVTGARGPRILGALYPA